MKYNIIKALAYEMTDILVDHDLRWTNNKIIEKIREVCFNAWLDWKEERMMDEFSREMYDLYKYYDYLESEGEVIAYRDEETGEMCAYTVEFGDPEDGDEEY